MTRTIYRARKGRQNEIAMRFVHRAWKAWENKIAKPVSNRAHKMWQHEVAMLGAVPLALTIAVLLFTPLRVSLNWDENVYASQISHHLTMLWSAERARGLPLLIAPVTSWSTSVVLLRVYLAVLAGLCLFLACLAWHGVRKVTTIMLAALIFAALAVTQSYASLVYPNYWAAIGGLAAVGLTLRLMRNRTRRDLVLAGFAVAFTGLMRPTDAVFLFVPLAVLVLVSRRRAALPVLASIAAGFAVFTAEWLVETFVYFRSISYRLTVANRASGGSRLDLLNNLRLLGGGHLHVIPGLGGVSGWSASWPLLWWAAFFGFALAGAWAMRREWGAALAVVPLVCFLSVYLLYSLPVRDNARYMLPGWALLSIAAADGLTAVTRSNLKLWARRIGLAAIVIFAGAELLTQHSLVVTQASEVNGAAARDNLVATVLAKRAHVRPPCTITSMPFGSGFVSSSEPAAYLIGCAYHWNLKLIPRWLRHDQVIVLVHGAGHPWPYALNWRKQWMGSGDNVAYISGLNGRQVGYMVGRPRR